MRRSPGFRGYYVINGGNDVGVSITLFDTQDAVQEAHRRAIAWIKDNLSDFYEGEPEVAMGEVVVNVPGQGAMAA